MILTTENSLHIILPHPCPKEALQDLQNAIIEVLQLGYEHPKNIGVPTEQENNGNYILLELLKATLQQENPEEPF